MINDRLRTAAKTEGVPLSSLRRQFVLECFLARMFARAPTASGSSRVAPVC